MVVGLALALAVWGWFDVRVRGTVDPNNLAIHKTDFTVFTEAGAAFFDGRDPYTVTNPRGWGYLYPPLFAILLAPLHALDPRTQVLVWFALSVLMGWGCYTQSVRIARAVLEGEPERGPFGPIPPWIGYSAIVATALPAFNCLQRGQVGLAKLYLLLLGFRLLVESRSAVRSFMAGTVLALAVVLKVTPVLPVAFLLFEQLAAVWHAGKQRTERPRVGAYALGTLGGLAAWLLLVPAMFVGWHANLHHLETWWNTVVVRAEHTQIDDFAGDNTSMRNQSLANAAHRFGNWADYYFAGGPNDDGPEQLHEGGGGLLMDAPLTDTLLRGVRLALGCLLLAVGYRMARVRDPLGEAAAFGLACVSTLVVMPIARVHYYLLFLPAVMFLSTWLLRRQRPRWAVFYAITPGVLIVAHYVLMDITGRIGLLGLGTTLWFTLASITLLRQSGTAVPSASEHGVQAPSEQQSPGPWAKEHGTGDVATSRAPICRDDLCGSAGVGSRSS